MKTKLTIERDRWIRGGKNGRANNPRRFPELQKENERPVRRVTSALRTQSGTMCCLGFACHAAGVPLDKLDYKSYPTMLHPRVKQRHFTGVWAFLDDDVVIAEMAKVNDINGHKNRVVALRELFKAQGVELEVI